MKNLGGRPHIDESLLRKKVVSTRLTEPEYLKLSEESKKYHLSLSEFIYQILINRKVVPGISHDETDLVRKLAGQSNNLNQLTKLAHAAGIVTIIPQLSELINKILNLIKLISNDSKNNTG